MSLPKFLTTIGTGIHFETEAEAVGNAKVRVGEGDPQVGVYQLIGVARRTEQPAVYEPVEAPKPEPKVKYLLQWRSKTNPRGQWRADDYLPRDSREETEALKVREDFSFPDYDHRIVEVPA